MANSSIFEPAIVRDLYAQTTPDKEATKAEWDKNVSIMFSCGAVAYR